MVWLQRDEWKAPAPKAALQRMPLPVSTVFLHHTVTPVSADPAADMRRVTNYSKYIDVPYTVVVHPDGTIMTGRYLNGVPALGAHTKGHNLTSLAVAVIGNYVESQPSAAAIESVAQVIESFVRKGFVTKSFVLKSHDQAPYATACCGTHLRAQIGEIYSKTKTFVGGDPVPYTPQPVIQVPQIPSNYAPAYPMLLKRGTKGIFVRQAQAELHDRKWRIVVDGIFGADTEKVVKAFQREKASWIRATYPEARNLSDDKIADGVIGRWTWNAIWKAPRT